MGEEVARGRDFASKRFRVSRKRATKSKTNKDISLQHASDSPILSEHVIFDAYITIVFKKLFEVGN